MTNQRIRCGQVRPPLCATVVAVLLAACVPAPAVPHMATPSPAVTPAQRATPTPRPDGLSPEQAATLASLRKVDDYPLYTMRYARGADTPVAGSRPETGSTGGRGQSLMGLLPLRRVGRP